MVSQSLSNPSIVLPALKAIAIAGSLANAGTMTTGYRFLPSIYPVISISKKAALKQWEFYYLGMSDSVPFTDLATFISCCALTFLEHKDGKDNWKLWASAAALMPIGWVFVRAVMMTPSNKLEAILNEPDTDGADKRSEQLRVLNLFKEFNSLLGVRMMWPWVVGGITLYASLMGQWMYIKA